MKLSIPDHILRLKPYVAGKPLEELEREYGITNAVKLASNENPLGPSPKARAAVAELLGELARYPDGGGFELRDALAHHHGCPARFSEQLIFLAEDLAIQFEQFHLFGQCFWYIHRAAIIPEFGIIALRRIIVKDQEVPDSCVFLAR